MIPWRDGLVVGLNNGAVFYWSPSNDPGTTTTIPTGWTTQDRRWRRRTASSRVVAAAGHRLGQRGDGHDAGGDGFAVGLTAPNNSHNGAVMLFTGFGAATSTSAFGYANSSFGPTALTPSNSFTQIANETALSTDSQGRSSR